MARLSLFSRVLVVKYFLVHEVAQMWFAIFKFNFFVYQKGDEVFYLDLNGSYMLRISANQFKDSTDLQNIFVMVLNT